MLWFRSQAPGYAASPTARPNRTLPGTPDMISTRAPSRAPFTMGVEITSSPLMCSRATVGSRSRNEASLYVEVKVLKCGAVGVRALATICEHGVAGRGRWNVVSGT